MSGEPLVTTQTEEDARKEFPGQPVDELSHRHEMRMAALRKQLSEYGNTPRWQFIVSFLVMLLTVIGTCRHSAYAHIPPRHTSCPPPRVRHPPPAVCAWEVVERKPLNLCTCADKRIELQSRSRVSKEGRKKYAGITILFVSFIILSGNPLTG